MAIPRLGLQAPVLASRLKTSILSRLTLKVNQVFLWSDFICFVTTKKVQEKNNKHYRLKSASSQYTRDKSAGTQPLRNNIEIIFKNKIS